MRWRIALSVGMGRNRPALGRLKEGGVVLQMLCRGLRAIRMQLVFSEVGQMWLVLLSILLLKRLTCCQRPLNDRRSVLSFGRGNSAIALVSPGLGPYPFLPSRYPAKSPSCDANSPNGVERNVVLVCSFDNLLCQGQHFRVCCSVHAHIFHATGNR